MVVPFGTAFLPLGSPAPAGLFLDDWKAIKGQNANQPYAIALKDGAPFWFDVL